MVAVCSCVDENQTSSISLSHSLSFSFSVFISSLPTLPFSQRPEIMRSLPSQGSFQIKTLRLSSHSIVASPFLSPFLHPHPVFHATGLLLVAPILGHALSLWISPTHTHQEIPKLLQVSYCSLKYSKKSLNLPQRRNLAFLAVCMQTFTLREGVITLR